MRGFFGSNINTVVENVIYFKRITLPVIVFSLLINHIIMFSYSCYIRDEYYCVNSILLNAGTNSMLGQLCFLSTFLQNYYTSDPSTPRSPL